MAKDYSDLLVQVRHTDRTLSNKALHPWSESWDIGWTGVIEGLALAERDVLDWKELNLKK